MAMGAVDGADKAHLHIRAASSRLTARSKSYKTNSPYLNSSHLPSRNNKKMNGYNLIFLHSLIEISK